MAIHAGDTVRVHYTGTLADGTRFDSSRDRDAMEFTVGKHQLIPGFENAVIGHERGDIIKVAIPPDQAYGEQDKELIFCVARSQVPQNIPLKVGTPLQLTSEKGGEMDVVITEVGPEEITLDANHPLCGKELHFEIEILDVKPAD